MLCVSNSNPVVLRNVPEIPSISLNISSKDVPIISRSLVNTSLTSGNSDFGTSGNETESKPCRSVVSFVNGIYHSYSELQKIGSLLEEIFSEEIRVFYNPSTGNWFSDAYRAGVELFYKPNDLLVAKSLAQHLRKALKDVGINGSYLHNTTWRLPMHTQVTSSRLQNLRYCICSCFLDLNNGNSFLLQLISSICFFIVGRVLHLAHSGGAIITYLAARYHLSSAETSRIDIATFGGGRSITRKYFRGGRIVNYYSQNDPLLLVDQRAALLSKLLNESTARQTVRDGGDNLQVITYNEIRDVKHNTTFIFLDGMMNNSILDHNMEGPTYVLALQLEAIQHKKKMKELSTFHEIQKHQFRLLRKKMARITGRRHFWDDSVPYSIRNIRKAASRLTNTHTFFSAFDQNWNSSAYFSSFFENDGNSSISWSGFLESWGVGPTVPAPLPVVVKKGSWPW